MKKVKVMLRKFAKQGQRFLDSPPAEHKDGDRCRIAIQYQSEGGELVHCLSDFMSTRRANSLQSAIEHQIGAHTTTALQTEQLWGHSTSGCKLMGRLVVLPSQMEVESDEVPEVLSCGFCGCNYNPSSVEDVFYHAHEEDRIAA